jgi:hypothetical protein
MLTAAEEGVVAAKAANSVVTGCTINCIIAPSPAERIIIRASTKVPAIRSGHGCAPKNLAV